jgi:diguanylate cyclase (GGDEF)-like protein/putative nucleotidyltransferase with HDIG domain
VRSIRTELIIWLSALGVLPALAATLVTTVVIWHAQRQDEGAFLERTAGAIARAIEHDARRVSRAAARAAEDPALARAAWPSSRERAEAVCVTLAGRYRLDALALYDGEGDFLAAHGDPPRYRGTPVSAWLPSKTDGVWFADAVPIGPGSTATDGRGWLVAYKHIGREFCLYANQTTGIVVGLHFPGHASVLSQSGGMALSADLAATLKTDRVTRFKVGDGWLMAVGKAVTMGGRDTGLRVLGAAAPHSHWDGMARAGWLTLAMLSGVLLLSSGAGAALARKIAEPLIEIAGAARSLAAGDLSRRVRIDGTNELQSLSESFNHMASALEEQTQQLRDSNQELDHQMARVQELNTLLREAVRTDSLTQVRTHGFIQQQLAKHLEVAKQSRRPLSVLMIDVDHFKWINDTHGHPTGDHALREVARAIASAVRHNDLVGRQGGDEFCVILPAAGAADAERCADRIRAAIARTSVRGANRTPLRLTVSVGTATFPDDGEEAGPLVAAADRTLYQAKLWRDRARHIFRPDGADLEAVSADSPLLDGPTVQVAMAMAASVGSALSSTVHHSYAVAARAAAIATALNLGRDGRAALRLACLLHDIGKVGLPREMLREEGPDTEEQQHLLESHAELGYRILRHLGLPQPIPEIVRCYHERYDGTGYPRGLKGEQIPLGARVAAVAEAFVKLTLPTERHKPLSSDDALAEIQAEAGKAFDASVVAALARSLKWRSASMASALERSPHQVASAE